MYEVYYIETHAQDAQNVLYETLEDARAFYRAMRSRWHPVMLRDSNQVFMSENGYSLKTGFGFH